MRINSINSANCINNSKKNPLINKNNLINFKGRDEFVKKDTFPEFAEVYNCLVDAAEIKDKKLTSLSSRVNRSIFDTEIVPLINGKYKNEYEMYSSFLYKNSPLEHVGKVLDKIFNNITHLLSDYTFDRRLGKNNGIAIISPDIQKAQDFLDCVPFFLKLRVLEADIHKSIEEAIYSPYEFGYKADYQVLHPQKDNYTTLDLLDEILDANQEKYEKTGKYSLLKIENAENLVRNDKNTDENISYMKHLFGDCAEKYHTMLLCPMPNLDPDKIDTEMWTDGRIVHKYFLDDLGITREDVDKLLEIKKTTEPLMSEIDKVYHEKYDILRGIQKRIEGVWNIEGDNRRELQKLYRHPRENKEKIIELHKKYQKEKNDIEALSLEELEKQVISDITLEASTQKAIKEAAPKEEIIETLKQQAEPKKDIQEAIKETVEQTIKQQPEPQKEVKEAIKETIEQTVKQENPTKETVKSVDTLSNLKQPFDFKNFLRSNKTFLAIGLILATAIGVGIAMLTKKKKINKNIQNVAANTTASLLNNLSLNKFMANTGK